MDPYGTEAVIEDEIHDAKPSEDIEDDDDKSQPHSGGGVDSAGYVSSLSSEKILVSGIRVWVFISRRL